MLWYADTAQELYKPIVSEKISKQVKSRVDLIDNPRVFKKKPTCVEIDTWDIA